MCCMHAKYCIRIVACCIKVIWREIFPLCFQGIQFLIENDLLKNTCDDIAQFLYKGEGLNKTAIGDYLGER